MNRCLHSRHWKEIRLDGMSAQTQKKTAAKRKIGANTQPMIGIHNRQLAVISETNPIRPGPIFCVLGAPAIRAGYPISRFFSGRGGGPAVRTSGGFSRNVFSALPAGLQRHLVFTSISILLLVEIIEVKI